MKRLLLLLALVCIIVPFALAAESTITNVVRVRIITDLLKDGAVSTPANYTGDKVDYIAPAIGSRYIEAVVAYYGGPVDGTNEEKAAFYLNQLRAWHRMIYRHQQERLAGATAASDADTQVNTDLGAEETP
uniref:Uncharacterized protein n=1 Tax=viral metagenome TaxID=1070528 RepID=A0A6M3JXI9_9ZZZZ